MKGGRGAERQRECICMSAVDLDGMLRERDRKHVCVCVCVCVRERESVSERIDHDE